jgi:hypothetical protein
MPIHYRIDRKHDVIFVVGEGDLALADVAAYCRGVVEEPDYRPGLNELVDFRGVTYESVSSADLRKLREVNRALSDKVGSSRLAYVVSDDLGFGLGRMFMALSDDSKIEHRVFRELAEARKWLGLPYEEPAESQP